MTSEELRLVHDETLRDWYDEFEKDENIGWDRLPNIPLDFDELLQEMDKRGL